MNQETQTSPHKRPSYLRRKKLIKPRIQLRLIGTFLSLIVLSFVLQAQLISSELAKLSLESSVVGLPSDAIPGLVLRTLAFSCLIFIPLVLALGVLSTFRLAGPIYRFEQYLSQLAKGEYPGPCSIRKGDDLQELCDHINAAVETLRAAQPAEREDDPKDDSLAA